MRGQIAVTEIEPGRLAEARHVSEGVKAFVAEAPAPGGVEGAGERIADRVEVRGDVQPPDESVVAGVDDHGELAVLDQSREPTHQLGRAGPAREGHDVHGTGRGSRRGPGGWVRVS